MLTIPLHDQLTLAKNDGDKTDNTGLDSRDRNNKTTLLFTSPGHTAKSFAKVSSQLVIKLQYIKNWTHFQRTIEWLKGTSPKTILIRIRRVE